MAKQPGHLKSANHSVNPTAYVISSAAALARTCQTAHRSRSEGRCGHRLSGDMAMTTRSIPFDPTDPQHMPPEQRIDELTAILAAGVLRMRERHSGDTATGLGGATSGRRKNRL